MKILFTSYSYGKLGDELAGIYMSMDRLLNDHLGARDYGPGMVSWFLMFIMVPPNIPGADDPERVLYQKKKAGMDLRLHISNEAFRTADEAGRSALVFACVLRSLDLMATKSIPNFNCAALKADVEAIGAEEGWSGTETWSC